MKREEGRGFCSLPWEQPDPGFCPSRCFQGRNSGGNYNSPDGKWFKVNPKEKEQIGPCPWPDCEQRQPRFPAERFRLQSHCVESLSSWGIKRELFGNAASSEGDLDASAPVRQTFRRHCDLNKSARLLFLIVSWFSESHLRKFKKPSIPVS